MSTNSELLTLAGRYLYGNYRPAQIVMVRGEGCELIDHEGHRYLDLAAGVAVCSVGHGHPRLAQAIGEQAAKLMHVSNYMYNEPNILLAAELCRRTGMARALFSNSGAEALEALIKCARRHYYGIGETQRTRIIAFDHAFHGRTIGALSVTGTPKYREGFPGIADVTHVPFGDLAAVEAAMGPDVAAVLVEPLQGEGGVLPAPPGFLKGLRALCDAHHSLFCVDEVQTGIGRLGHLLAIDDAGVKADIVALAKGLGGGFPIGVILTSKELEKALPPGTHGSTFGGNALASMAALTVLSILDDEKLVEGVREKGERLEAMLAEVVRDFPNACESSRGQGLLWGLVLRPGHVARDKVADLLKHHVLVTAAGDHVVRFSPPLTISAEQLERGIQALRAVLQDA